MTDGLGLLATKLRGAAGQARYLPRALRLVWAASRRWTLLWIGLLVAQGLLPVAVVYLTRELVDNLVMLAVPGAMDAPLSSPLFWSALAFALAVAAAAAFPLNRWLIARGRGHAAVHAHHHHH